MDRFIAPAASGLRLGLRNLKSNMDRFIAVYTMVVTVLGSNLKSNMDRFIVCMSYAEFTERII